MDMKKLLMQNYMGTPVRNDRADVAWQLAVEYIYLTESFDRTLPHDLLHDVAWVDPKHMQRSSRHASKLLADVDRVGKKKRIDPDYYREKRSRVLRLTFDELKVEYKHYNGNYLLGGKQSW